MTKHISYGPILPKDEMARLIRKQRGTFSRTENKSLITRADLMRHIGDISKTRLKQIEKGQYHGPEILARLSKFLVLIEMGLVVKRNGKIVYLENPEAPPKEIVFKLDLFGKNKLFQFIQPNYQVGRL